MNKQLVQVKDSPYIYLDFDLITGDINEISKNILGIKNKLKEAYDKREEEGYISNFTPFEDYTKIELYIDYGYGGDKDLTICVYRWETDIEYEIRLALDKKRSEAAKTKKEGQEKRERTLLENLKKKYE